MKRIIVPLLLVAFCGFSWFYTINDYKTGKSEVVALLSSAEDLYEKRIYNDAEDAYKKVLLISPDNKKALLGLANTYFKMEEYTKVLETCEKALKSSPNQQDFLLLKAKSLESGGEYAKSLEIYTKMEQTKSVKKEINKLKSMYSLTYYSGEKAKEWLIYSPFEHQISTIINKKVGLVYNSIGKKVTNGSLSYIGPVSDDGKLFPAIEDGTWCYVDKEGNRKLVPDDQYDFLGPFCNGFAVAKKKDTFGYVDTSFKEYSFKYEKAYNFVDGKAVVLENGKINIIDSSFNAVKKTEYTDVVSDEYGYTSHFDRSIFIKEDKYYICDTSGAKITDFSADYIGLPMESGGLVEYKLENLYGYLDSKTGKKVIKTQFDEAKAFACGLGTVKVSDKWGFIDESGTFVVDPIFDSSTSLSNSGSAWVTNEAGLALLTFYVLSDS